MCKTQGLGLSVAGLPPVNQGDWNRNMFGKSIKIRKDLLERAQEHAQKAGYSSVEEFVSHLIERELAQSEAQQSDPDLLRKMKGLGYIE